MLSLVYRNFASTNQLIMARRLAFAVMLIGWIALLLPQKVYAHLEDIREYTVDHPLVYEDSWDLWPYAFLDMGKPTGYNVELVEMVMNRLGIPYTIKLKERLEVLNDLKEGRADLSLGMAADFHNPYATYGKTIVQLFTHSVLTPKGMPVGVKTEQDLKTHKVIVHNRSFSHHLMVKKGWSNNAIPYNDMKKAVQDLSVKGEGELVWNTVSLQWLINMLHIDNLQLTPIDMPHGEYHFMSNDLHLLAQIDSIYPSMQASRVMSESETRWFYPDKNKTGIPTWVWYIVQVLIVISVLLLFFFITYRIKENRENALSRLRNSRLALILQNSHVRIWLYHVEKQVFTLINEDGKYGQQYTTLEFGRRFHSQDYEQLLEHIQQIAEQARKKVVMEVKARYVEDPSSAEEREFQVVLSALRYENGKPSVVIGTQIDVTEEHRKQRHSADQLSRYRSLFNTAMIDIAYYDEKGYVTDMNQRAEQTFNLTLEDAISKKININTTVECPDDMNQFEPFHATVFMNNQDSKQRAKSPNLLHEICYELKLTPVFNNQHQLLCIYGSGRDVTEVANTYHQMKKSIDSTEHAMKNVTDYVKNINFVLGVGGVRIVNYSPNTHTLTVFKELNVVQHALTQSRCMTLIDENSKKEAMRMLNSMDNLTTKPVEMVLQTIIRRKNIPLYLQFRFIPMLDEETGKVVNYFGLCRDTSEIKATELLLEQETTRAQEVESLKNSFLRNMSFEIRTPLSNVVGFSELFEMDHQAEDEEVFIKEIKNSSAHLLQLINDILFLSRLDAQMIEINKQETDFAMTFEGHCQMGWGTHQKEGVRYITENHYNRLVVDIDDTNVGRIIEQVVTNAAQHTHTGTVRARYDYINGKLMIAVDDTGNGMSEETLSHVYERFSTGNNGGTGLGLPICKELAEQMGGSIDISSEEGKGTTVWIIMPCTASVVDRKKEI